MSIEAFCPSGHRILCPDESAGRAARCPKCQTPFRIPGGNEQPPTNSDEAQPSAPKVPADHIIFLCPNGHRLNGPAKLAGRLGQCPHCHEKFQIPPLEVIRAAQAAGENGSGISNLESVEIPDSETDDSSVERSGSNEAEAGTPHLEIEDLASTYENPEDLAQIVAAVQAVETREAAHRASASGMNLLGGGSHIGRATLPPQSAKIEIHALADLVMRLWGEREHGGVIELHLAGGTVLLPDWFDKKLSTRTYGLFAAQAADTTVTMTIVPWETVERVVIRGVVGLPDGMFE